jgi:hypothetical protein
LLDVGNKNGAALNNGDYFLACTVANKTFAIVHVGNLTLYDSRLHNTANEILSRP